MKKILIIGASGLLGNRMMEVYSAGYEVYGTYNKRKVGSQNLYELDVTSKTGVAALVGRLKPDLIVDTHGLTSLDACEANKEEAIKINVDGTRNVADSAKAAGCKYVFISTDTVFDGRKWTAYTEDDKPNPLNYYGTTKAMAENIVTSYPGFIVARTSVLFGKGVVRKPPIFTNWVLEQLRGGQSAKVVTDQYNNPTYIDSCAQFVLRLYENGASGIFHTAGKETISRFEFAKKIADVFGFDRNLILPTTTTELKLATMRPLWVGLDISKAEKAAGMKGMNIDEALKAFKSSISS